MQCESPTIYQKGEKTLRKVLITGANGFIAKSTARTLKEAGCYIIGTSRNPAPVSHYNEIVHGVLGEPLKDVFENYKLDAVIHCAFDKENTDNIKNAEGTYIWAEQAEKNNVALQIFISSLSADEVAFAPYGQRKYEVEKWFLRHNHIVFRPGLVVGNGGLFGRIVTTVKKNPVIPLIDNGKTLTYFTDVDTLSEIVRDTVFNNNKVTRSKVWHLQQEFPVFLGDILKEIAKHYNMFRLFIPVPHIIISFILRVTEKMVFLKLGINVNNLKGMRQHGQRKYKSDLNVLGYPETSIELLIKKLVL
jgi:nucleoside-diphosphate-sugar epimerase